MRIYYSLVFVLCIGGISTGQCQVAKSSPLVITANDVITNSIRITPLPIMTNVDVSFRFEGKSAEDIKILVGRNITKPVTVAGGDSARTQGVVAGLLVESNNVPVGIVISFETRADAEKAKKALRERGKP